MLRRPLAILTIAALLAALLISGALLFTALLVVVAILPLAPLVAERWPRAGSQRAPRFLRAAVSLLRAPPGRLA